MTDQMLEVKNQLNNTIKQYELNYPPKKRHPKLGKLITYLKENPDIRFILSDKNLGIVAIETQTYNELVLQHLESEKYELIGPNNTLFFQPFHSRLNFEFLKTIELIQNTETDTDILNYTKYYKTYHNWSLPAFHVLLKLHKGLHPLKSRPIVAALNWFTTPVSRVLAKKIFTLFKDKNQIAHNTFDVITAISKFNIHISSLNIDHLYLVTLDITDLYTNIDLNTLENLLQVTDLYYAKLMNFVCKNNYMFYNDSVYKQTNGIAMGTNCAPELANFYLMHILDPILLKHPKVKLYRRYLDDLLLVWYGNKSDFQDLLILLKQKTNLGFTLKGSKNSVDFLDLKVFLRDGIIEYCTHQKLLNKYGYIAMKSCHPTHTFSGFIKGELTRYAINSSRLQYYLVTKYMFFKRLIQRGYSRRFLSPLFESHTYSSKFHGKSKATVNTNTSITSLPIRYSFRRNIKGLTKVLRVKSNYLCRKELPLHSTRITWRRSRNLYDMLCSSRLSPQQASFLKHPKPKPPLYKL